MSHLSLLFAFITRMNAIRQALDFDLADLSEEGHQHTKAAARMWVANFNAYALTMGRDSCRLSK